MFVQAHSKDFKQRLYVPVWSLRTDDVIDALRNFGNLPQNSPLTNRAPTAIIIKTNKNNTLTENSSIPQRTHREPWQLENGGICECELAPEWSTELWATEG